MKRVETCPNCGERGELECMARWATSVDKVSCIGCGFVTELSIWNRLSLAVQAAEARRIYLSLPEDGNYNDWLRKSSAAENAEAAYAKAREDK